MVTHAEYAIIVQKLCRVFCTPKILECLKTKYKSVIASHRSMEKVVNIHELITILEKRDIINEHDVRILEDIASAVGRPDILQPHIQIQAIPSPPNIFNQITYIIGREIGHRWKDFARELTFREGDIDALEAKHRDVSERIRDIMNDYHKICPAHLFKTNLLRALAEARRRDLSYEIAAVMDNYSAGYLSSY